MIETFGLACIYLGVYGLGVATGCALFKWAMRRRFKGKSFGLYTLKPEDLIGIPYSREKQGES